MITEVIEPLGPEAPDPKRASWIRKTPGLCGGDACIRNTRISVWVLEGYRRLGLSQEELLAAYPRLTAEDLRLAQAYAAAHPQEIDQAIQDNEAA